jgi:hypothetical protein
MQDIDRLIDDILAREIRATTREEMATFRKELAAGTLADDDARYVRALHARIVGGGLPKAQDTIEESQAGTKPADIDALRAALAQSQQREKALEAERDRLQRLVGDLRKEIDALKAEKS